MAPCTEGSLQEGLLDRVRGRLPLVGGAAIGAGDPSPRSSSEDQTSQVARDRPWRSRPWCSARLLFVFTVRGEGPFLAGAGRNLRLFRFAVALSAAVALIVLGVAGSCGELLRHDRALPAASGSRRWLPTVPFIVPELFKLARRASRGARSAMADPLDVTTELVIALVFVFAFAFTNGIHDASNAREGRPTGAGSTTCGRSASSEPRSRLPSLPSWARFRHCSRIGETVVDVAERIQYAVVKES